MSIEPCDSVDDAIHPAALHNIPFSEAVRVWIRVAALSFGGPAGQIAVMHRILVEEKKWIGEQRFLHALNYCMLLPGPEAQQLATYIGWLLHKTKGGIVSGSLFILPGFLSILALSYIYAIFGNVRIVEGLFFGLKAAVLAIVIQAVIRIGSRALKNNLLAAIAAGAFVLIFLFDAPFPLIILLAAITGFIGARAGIRSFFIQTGHGSAKAGLADADSELGEFVPEHARPSLRWSLKVSGAFLFLWFTPIIFLYFWLGPDHVFTNIATFFSKMATVTFGGAYAVLSYVAQAAVDDYRWLAPGEMLDGLGMAETTPGPLIQVVQFVGFMAAFRYPGSLNPLVAATLGAVLTTWVTFVPCFLWIFLGAPFIEAIRGQRALSAALAAITAAVVGVILNLALWFALHVLFRDVRELHRFGMTLEVPVWETLDPFSLILTVAAFVAVFRFKISMIALLVGCSATGALYYILGA